MITTWVNNVYLTLFDQLCHMRHVYPLSHLFQDSLQNDYNSFKTIAWYYINRFYPACPYHHLLPGSLQLPFDREYQVFLSFQYLLSDLNHNLILCIKYTLRLKSCYKIPWSPTWPIKPTAPWGPVNYFNNYNASYTLKFLIPVSPGAPTSPK